MDYTHKLWSLSMTREIICNPCQESEYSINIQRDIYFRKNYSPGFQIQICYKYSVF